MKRVSLDLRDGSLHRWPTASGGRDGAKAEELSVVCNRKCHSVEIVRVPAFRSLMAQSSWAAAAPLHSDATCETLDLIQATAATSGSTWSCANRYSSSRPLYLFKVGHPEFQEA